MQMIDLSYTFPLKNIILSCETNYSLASSYCKKTILEIVRSAFSEILLFVPELGDINTASEHGANQPDLEMMIRWEPSIGPKSQQCIYESLHGPGGSGSCRDTG